MIAARFLKVPAFKLSPGLKFIQRPYAAAAGAYRVKPYPALHAHQHPGRTPRAAIYRDTDDRDKYAEFYERLLEGIE